MKDWEKSYWIGVVAGGIGVGLSVALVFYTSSACAQTSWQNNPFNYKNSSYNYYNNQYNYKNSQYNWENNPYNLDSKTGIYTLNGNRVGYEVPTIQGTRNIYDLDSERIGYLQ